MPTALVSTLALLLLAIAVRAAETPPAAEPCILVTAYGPFDGRGINGSATLARRLDGSVIAGHRVRIEVLPVRWGAPQATLPTAIAAAEPALLLGLGEGWPDKVTCELVGRNVASHPDVDGKAPPAPTLEASGPAERRARLVFDAAWFAGGRIPVVASEDAGAYLCNALLYTALAQPTAKVGFVHVPPQGAVDDERYAAALLPIVRTIIEKNLAP